MKDIVFNPFVDVFMQGSWAELAEIEDPELKELADTLPALALLGRAPEKICWSI